MTAIDVCESSLCNSAETRQAANLRILKRVDGAETPKAWGGQPYLRMAEHLLCSLQEPPQYSPRGVVENPNSGYWMHNSGVEHPPRLS